ncbi:MAG: hypothetical protein AAGB06_01465 [Verrucomicrobiota bacterium]
MNNTLNHLEGPSYIEERFSSDPTWVLKERLDAWERFSALAMPTRKDEQWRFATVNRTLLDEVELAMPNEGLLKASTELPAAREALMHFHFVDDVLVTEPEIPEALARQGVILSSLKNALIHHEAAIFRLLKMTPWRAKASGISGSVTRTSSTK